MRRGIQCRWKRSGSCTGGREMIEFKNVVKRFGDVKAIDDVSAAIDEGHVFGLIGTNGAGSPP